MLLKRLILKNFRPYHKKEVRFQKGITGIIGPNGGGKSSIAEAIQFLFTGEGFGTKTDMLAIGETSGYVVGEFELDDKPIVLERHLDSSKVVLQYDGQVYKKSSDVAELWDKLFKIDKALFKNIIIAKQGEIALLFSGDNSVREKLYQKIFMVPNTTKLRDIVLNDYIKKCPPELVGKDEIALRSDIQCLEKLIELGAERIAEIPDNGDDLFIAKSRVEYLNKCIANNELSVKVTKEIEVLTTQVNDVLIEIREDKIKLANIDLQLFLDKIEVLKAVKLKYDEKARLEGLLKELVPVEFSKENEDALAELETMVNSVVASMVSATNDVAEANKKLKPFVEKDLVGKKVCPTCNSELTDVSFLINNLQAVIAEAGEKHEALKVRSQKLKANQLSLQTSKEAYTKYVTERTNLEEQLQQYVDVVFDQEEFNIYTEVVKQYKEIDDNRLMATIRAEDLKAQLMDKQLEKAHIVDYDNYRSSAAEELTELTEKIAKLESNNKEKTALQIEFATNKKELALLQSDLLLSKEAMDKNKRREKYMDILDSLHKVMHTSEFPRKLIQSYSDVVSEYLNEHLARFNFPYITKVNDNFSIDCYNKEGLRLPSVSGGQAVMIGISLRLAVHTMFGTAMPLMIFDEGSTHLSMESKKVYYEMMAELKNVNNFKQIIIIDHDELANYVDNTISLYE